MALEIEIKLRVASHGPIVKALRGLGAKHKGAVRERNLFFDRGNHVLRKKDSGLRVRFTEPWRVKGGKTGAGKRAALLTFKGPARRTGLRSREAFDLTVTPGDQIVPLLEGLGFAKLFEFEKMRDSWRLGGCLVELDRLPVFGLFVEIEGPSERAVKQVQKRLGLQGVRAERVSYSRMVGEYLKGRAGRELRF